MRISDWSSDVCSSDLSNAGNARRLDSGRGAGDRAARVPVRVDVRWPVVEPRRGTDRGRRFADQRGNGRHQRAVHADAARPGPASGPPARTATRAPAPAGGDRKTTLMTPSHNSEPLIRLYA